MGRFSHWSLTYALDKARDVLYRRSHRGMPWLTPGANRFLEEWLRPEHHGLEWGAGRSTVWFAKRVGGLVSVEHDPVWARRVTGMLEAVGARNVGLLTREASHADYVGVADSLAEDSLDFVLVDGVSGLRDACAAAALSRVRPGGLMIIDDAQRYIPCKSRVPHALSADDAPASPLWGEVAQCLSKWECIRTSDGIRDTVIWRRPG